MLISSSKSRCWERCGAVLVHGFQRATTARITTPTLDPTSYLIVAAVTALLPAWHSGGETYKSAGVFPDLNVCKKVKLDEI